MSRFGRALNFRMNALVPIMFQGFVIEIYLCEDSLLQSAARSSGEDCVYESEPVICTITLNCEDRLVGWTAHRSPMDTVKEACRQVNCILDQDVLRQKTCEEMLPIVYDTGLDPDKYFTVLGIRVDHLPPMYAVRALFLCFSCFCSCASIICQVNGMVVRVTCRSSADAGCPSWLGRSRSGARWTAWWWTCTPPSRLSCSF